MKKSEAKRFIKETCGQGWLTLVDIVFDNKPEDVEIIEVFQKQAGLKVRFLGENENFDELLNVVYNISQKMCEVCGESAGYTIIDGWETTLCPEHFSTIDAKEKYKQE